jgi:hypothetical protein
MKVSLYIVLFLFVFRGAYAQITSDCTVPPSLVSRYENDVKYLALIRMYQLQLPDTVLIDVPQVYQDTIWHGLAAIYNLGTQLSADSVFDLYCIHAEVNHHSGIPSKASHGSSIMMKVDTGYAWTDAWSVAGQTWTGYQELDDFLSQYGFQMTTYLCNSGPEYLNNWAILESPHVVNVKAFGDSLEKFDGLLYANYEYSGSVGDGNTISYSGSDTAQYYAFRLGWGDCPSGCTSSRIWYYRVGKKCTVTLDSIKSFGSDSFPVPPNCDPVGLSVLARQNQMKIFPNPAGDFLIIEKDSREAVRPDFYLLSDMQGRVMLTGKFKRQAKLSFKGFAPGIYLLKIIEDAGVSIYRKVVIR